MNSVETERALTSLIPAIKRDGAEAALLKYASDRNLAPAQLEHLAQAYNKVLVIAHTKTANERGADVAILDTHDLVAKYTDADTGLHSKVKSASVKTVPGSYRNYTVGDHFGKSASKNMWMEFEKDDKENPDQVNTFAKQASEAPGMDADLAVREAEAMKFDALDRWDRELRKLAHATRNFDDFVAVVQDVRHLSPAACAVVENGLRTKQASMKIAWHGVVPADPRDFFTDRRKIADTVTALEDAWFEASACAQLINEIKSAATEVEENVAEKKSQRKKPRMDEEVGANEFLPDDPRVNMTTAAIDAFMNRHNGPEEGSPLAELHAPSNEDLQGNPDYKHDVQGNVQQNPKGAPVLQDADKHFPSRLTREANMLNLLNTPAHGVGNYSPPPGKDRESDNLAGLGSALGGVTEGIGTSMKNIMTSISDHNAEDRGMGAARGLSSFMAAPREQAVNRLQGSIRTMRERATLQRLMMSDPVISSHNPADVVEAFNTIRSVYPQAAGDINMARQLIRESLGYQGVPVSTVAQLADINKKTQPEKKAPVK